MTSPASVVAVSATEVATKPPWNVRAMRVGSTGDGNLSCTKAGLEGAVHASSSSAIRALRDVPGALAETLASACISEYLHARDLAAFGDEVHICGYAGKPKTDQLDETCAARAA